MFILRIDVCTTLLDFTGASIPVMVVTSIGGAI